MNGLKEINSLHKVIWSSLIFHALALVAILGISNAPPASRVIQIDFSIEDPANPSRKNQTKPALPKKQEIIKNILQKDAYPMPKNEEPVLRHDERPVQNTAISPLVSENHTPVTAPAVQQGRMDSSPAKNNTEVSSAGSSIESVKQKYLKEHFTYIRDMIQKKLTYPRIARQMGWAGKVIVSFVISTDGNVKDIKITEGSGFEILDKNAAETVRKISPFPKPPVEAQLLIPVKYSLN